jgi:hypothetical protein
VANAKASPITYTESASINGSLNGVSITDELLALTGTGNTANITHPDVNTFEIPVTATFSVGSSSGTFTDAIVVFAQANDNAGFEDLAVADILDTHNVAFGTYNLSTSIGPLTGDFGLINPGFSFPTTAGALIINSLVTNPTFTAAAGATATPLPAALPLFATGIGGLGLLGWRRKRKAQAV